MSSNYPTIAGDYIAKISQNRIKATTAGNISTINLTSSLPADMILAINGKYPVYARLGCRQNGLFEYVLIEKGSYKSDERSLRIIRGQSPFSTCSGGEPFEHIAAAPGSLELNFYAINPCAFQNLIEDVDVLKNNIGKYITDNIGGASTTEKGLIKVSYFNPSKPVDEDYAAITNDNPFLKQFIAKTLDLPTNSPLLNFDRAADSSAELKLQTLNQLLSYFYNNPNKLTSFISFLNNL